MEHKIRQLIDNEKTDFKIKYWLKLTMNMISMVSWISINTLNRLYYYWPIMYMGRTYRDYYEQLKKLDFSKFVNKRALKSKKNNDTTPKSIRIITKKIKEMSKMLGVHRIKS